MRRLTWLTSLAIVASSLCGSGLHASTFKTITIDDDYSDWVGVPVLDSDGGDNQGGPDIGETQIANDNNYLYVRNTFPNNLALGTFISLDVDQNAATGYDLFGLGLMGSDAGWQNDFAFAQATGVFNSGGLSGEFFGGGHALLSPFANAGSRELAFSLSALFAANNAPVFPDNTISLLVWTDLGVGPDGTFGGFNGDVSRVIQYTLAVPEPSSIVMACIALVAIGRRRR
jgi:PEP-CTERM motif